MKRYKILVVGNFNWEIYEQALIEGFLHLGHIVSKYIIESLSFKTKLLSPSILMNINKDFFSFVKSERPDIIFLYRNNELTRSTIKKIHDIQPGIFIISYNNDNTFVQLHRFIKYWNFHRLLKVVNLSYVYRESNIDTAYRLGAKKVKILMPHYFSRIHLNSHINFDSKIHDVVFVGHVENDGRIEVVDYLIKNGIKLKIFGPGWQHVGVKNKWPEGFVNGPVYGEDYYAVVSKSFISLCFISKSVKDVYTRRVFEIPAMGSLLATHKTDYIMRNFVDGKNAVIYNSKEELYTKIIDLLRSPQKIKEITLEGYRKVVSGGFSEVDRAKQIIEDFQSCTE